MVSKLWLVCVVLFSTFANVTFCDNAFCFITYYIYMFAYYILAGYPLKGKSSVCAFSMKYRKMIFIIIIISLGKILLSYIANTSCMHARMHALARTHTHSRSHQPTTIAVLVVVVRWVGAPNHDEVNAHFSPPLNGRSCFIRYSR